MRLVTAAAIAMSVAAQAPPPASPLSAGSSVERSLAPGERHTYRIDLAAGDFLHLVVEQRGIDVAVSIAARGRTLAESDSPNGAFGFERLAIVAPAAATYDVTVQGPPRGSAGSYALSVRAVRPATDRDRQHAAAEQAFTDANVARRANTGASRAQAVEKFGEAAVAFGALGLEYECALAHHASGLTHLNGGETRAALVDLEAALPIVKRLDDPLLPTVLNALGGAYDILGDLARAEANYRDALTVFRGRGNTAGEANALNNLGKIANDRGDAQLAIELYTAALPLTARLGEPRLDGIVRANVAMAYRYLGDMATAGDFFEAALTLSRKAGDKPGEANVLTGLARLDAARGVPERAVERYQEAIALRRQVGDRRAEAITLLDMAGAYQSTGAAERARSLAEQAVALTRATGDRRNEGLAQRSLASALHDLGRLDDADATERQALDIFTAIDDRVGVAATQYLRARTERALGRLDAAVADVEAAVAGIETTRHLVSGNELRSTYFAQHHDLYGFAIDLQMQLHAADPDGGHDRGAFELSERARARTLLDSLADAGARVSGGRNPALLERERRIATDINAKASRLMQLAGRPGVAEARTLDREIRALEGEADEVRAEIRRTNPAYAALVEPRPVTAASLQNALDPDTVLVEYTLGSPASWAWTIDRQAIHAVGLADEATIRDAVAAVRDAISGPRTTSARASLRNAIDRLSALVLDPVAPNIDVKRVVVVPDGALQYVSFAMLGVNGRNLRARVPLVTTSDVVMLPSASALTTARSLAASRRQPTRGVVVLADPVFDTADSRARSSGTSTAPTAADASRILAHGPATIGITPSVIPRLPFTRQEAAAIARAAGAGRTLQAVGFDATKSLVLDGTLGDYRYVHFATHGYADPDRSALSAVVLSLVSKDGSPQDGFLRAHELYGLELSADLVVLSACETGLGKDIRGEGLVGLTRGFMYAGAARVVGSLWPVSDRATAVLMGAFYTEMLQNGRSPAAALRLAQLAVRRTPQWQDPFYWAGFIIEGDWR